MENFKILSPADQLANYLRDQILKGTWRDEVPGVPKLAEELEVDHRMVIAAFHLLENEGLLAPQGAGRRRKIIHRDNQAPPVMRVKILLYEQEDIKQFYILDLLHQLTNVGHIASFASKSIMELNMDTKRIINLVGKTEADAWVIFSGPREILEWFSKQPKPAFALAGRRRDTRIAGSGPDKVPALRVALRRLIALGHRRIVLLSREVRRKPIPGLFEREFLAELETHGIRTGPYNLPDWDNNMDDFHRCIDSLIRHTPPTALIVDEMLLFIAAQQHLAQCGFLVPRDISMVCNDPDPAFAWCKPSVAHIYWNPDQIIRRIVLWADHIARGIDDRRQNFVTATFVEGGTVGPAPSC